MTKQPIIEVKQGDVTAADADLLVNASNTKAWLGSGVSGAIRRACGAGYQEAITAALAQRFDAAEMEPGDVLITDAGAHPRAKLVAHVAVMDYRPGHESEARPDEARIERGSANLWSAIESAPGTSSLSIAMVALGAGTGGLGVRKPTELACTTLRTHLAGRASSRIAKVIFYGWETHEFANIVHVVRQHFALDEASIPADVLAFVKGMD